MHILASVKEKKNKTFLIDNLLSIYICIYLYIYKYLTFLYIYILYIYSRSKFNKYKPCD